MRRANYIRNYRSFSRSAKWATVIITIIFSFLSGSVAFATIAQRDGATTGTTTSTSLPIAKPTGVLAGDVMIVNIAKVGNNTTAPSLSGWTLIDGRSLAGGTLRYAAVLYRVADGTEGSSFTFALGSGTNGAVGSIVAFSGVNTSGATPFDVTPGTISVQASQTGVVAASITTASANAAVIMFGEAAASSPTFSGWTTTSPGALAELYDNRVGTTASVGAAWAIKATAGSTGAGAATLNGAERNGGILIALKPALSIGRKGQTIVARLNLDGKTMPPRRYGLPVGDGELTKGTEYFQQRLINEWWPRIVLKGDG